MHIKEFTYVARSSDMPLTDLLKSLVKRRITGSVKISFHQGGIAPEILVTEKVSATGKNGVSLDTLAGVCSNSELGRPSETRLPLK